MEALPRQIQEHFKAHADLHQLKGPLGEIVASLKAGTLTKGDRQLILREAGVSDDESYRKAELDLVLSFFETAIREASFSPEQGRAFKSLKELFEVREGDFLRYRRVELATLLGNQMETILEDEVIDPAEDEYQVALQAALDLGFDQYMALCRRAFESASCRLQDALGQEVEPARRANLQRNIDALEPMIRLAELQQRSLGALY